MNDRMTFILQGVFKNVYCHSIQNIHFNFLPKEKEN
jgi:hypothetical protein